MNHDLTVRTLSNGITSLKVHNQIVMFESNATSTGDFALRGGTVGAAQKCSFVRSGS